MISPELLSKIRQIRTKQDLQLKPSPYLRDKYTDEYGEERDVKLRVYQAQAVLNMLQVERMLNGDDTGLGKAQPVDSLVLTPSGWVRIGDVRPGDEVIGSNGKPTTVLGVFPQGEKDVFRVTMSDGSSTECCEEHLWAVRTDNSRHYDDGWHVRSLKQIRAAGLTRQKNKTELRWEIPLVAPVEFPRASLKIDPYLLGVLLGNGSFIDEVNITSDDPDLFDLAAEHFPPGCTYGHVSKDGLTRSVVSTTPGRNPLILALERIGLKGANWCSKHIPREYLLSSIDQRVALLRGLMDTCGSISKDGKVTKFYSLNGTLVGCFVRLVMTLGGTAKVTPKFPVLRGKSRAKDKRPSYTVTVALPNSINPFSLPKKANRWVTGTKYLPRRHIQDICFSRRAECVCIKVAAADSLYVTDDFIVTHNTLEVLSTIGYIWMKEPEYVPIIVTTKSALFQWEGETQRFMRGMEAVTVHGSPFRRHEIYEDFFSKYDPQTKRLLILSYDMIMYDMHEAVIKGKKRTPRPGFNRELDAARTASKQAAVLFEAEKEKFDAYFRDHPWQVHQYLADFVNCEKKPQPPSMFTEADAQVFASYLKRRQSAIDAETKLKALRDEAAPPKKVPGIIDYVMRMKQANPHVKLLVVMDEMHKLKNHKSQFHEKTALLAKQAQRAYGLTATPVKNRLMEFWSLFRILVPSLFPKISQFYDQFCITKLQPIGGGRNVRLVVGYRNLDEFVSKIEPYYLSRKKHDVAKELPELVSMEIECELTELQQELYDLAENGLINKNNDPNTSESELLSAMIMCQQACDSPELIMDENGEPYKGPSSKIDALIELLQTEAADQKVIVFSKFERMITLVESALKAKDIACTRITGKESNAQVRDKNRAIFQDMNSGVNVILITTAGSESLNLHSAEHFALLDLPWSWGDYLQLIGRALRIGSLHKMVVAHHFLGRKRDEGKTIDHQVLKALRAKKKLADKVAGENLKGGLNFVEQNVLQDVLQDLLTDKSKTPVKVKKANKPTAQKSTAISENSDYKIADITVDLSDV